MRGKLCGRGEMSGRKAQGLKWGQEDKVATLEHAEQLTDEQVGQLVRQTRSRTKAARTQAAPSARTNGAAVIEEEEAEGVEK